MRMPAPSKPRDRRLIGDEGERMLNALAGCENPYMRPFMLFALETSTRLGASGASLERHRLFQENSGLP